MNFTMSTGAGAAVLEAHPTDVQRHEETKTILLLDEARLFLQLEETLLRRRGHRVITATTGALARDILASEPIDLILMDYRLPDETGDSLVRWIRSDPSRAGIGIVIVTARGRQEDVDACIAAGCNAFLFKPVSGPVLCERVQQLLNVPVRRHVRTLVRLQVDGQCEGRFFFGNTVNLSEGGLLVESSVRLAPGETLGLRFFLPASDEPLSVRARVVRVSEAAEGGVTTCGLVFDELAPADALRIAAFVDSRQAAHDRGAEPS